MAEMISSNLYFSSQHSHSLLRFVSWDALHLLEASHFSLNFEALASSILFQLKGETQLTMAASKNVLIWVLTLTSFAIAAHHKTIYKDVVILGGGASGSHAAVRLREDYNKSIIIVEKQANLVCFFPFSSYRLDLCIPPSHPASRLSGKHN